MSDLTMLEKRKLEKLFGMSSGYVLNFSNRTFAEFIKGVTGYDISDACYDYASGSKANRLRAFWERENNQAVGTLTCAMIDYCFEEQEPKPGAEAKLTDECRQIAARLLGEPASTRMATTSQAAAAQQWTCPQN